MHRNSRLIFAKYAPPYFREGMRVLEIAPDDFPSQCRQSLGVRNMTWETLDVGAFVSKDYGARLTYLAEDPYRYPVPDASFDIILNANVIEHVPKPWAIVAESAQRLQTGRPHHHREPHELDFSPGSPGLLAHLPGWDAGAV